MALLTTLRNIARPFVHYMRTTGLYWFFKDNQFKSRAYLKKCALADLVKKNPHLPPEGENTVTIAVMWEATGRLNNLSVVNDAQRTRLVIVPRSVIKPGWQFYLKQYHNHSASSFGDYSLESYLSDAYVKDRERFRNYCRNVIAIIQEEYQFEAIIMPKLTDDWTLDFIQTLREMHIKVIVDDRESAVAPKRLEVIPELWRGLLDVEFDFLTTHNRLQHQIFVESGMPEDKMHINGVPLSDYFHLPQCWQTRAQIHPQISTTKKVILFLAFGPRSYIHFYFGDEKRNWTDLCAGYHHVLLDLVKKHHNDIQIIYKSGGKPLRDLFARFDEFYAEAKPYFDDNTILRLDGTYNTLDLINTSDVILGFQTSGMVEAMFTDKPIIYGAWGELYDDIKESILPLHKSKGLVWCQSPDSLFMELENAAFEKGTYHLSETCQAGRRETRGTYFEKADGHVSERLIEIARNVALDRPALFGIETPEQ